MFMHFWYGAQQDFKIFLLAPLLAGLFRLIFIEIYGPEKLPGKETFRKWFQCFAYGLRWGLDWHAYAFLLPLVLISIPGAFLPAYYEIGDTLRGFSSLLICCCSIRLSWAR